MFDDRKLSSKTRPTIVAVPNANETPWLMHPHEFDCAQVLASLRSSSNVTHVEDLQEGLAVDDSPETKLPEWRRLQILRFQINLWASIWGGVQFWSDSLQQIFTSVCSEGTQAVNNWSLEIWRHADAGRELLVACKGLEGDLPDEPYAIRIMWREYSKLIELLVQGITIIDTRLAVVNPDMFTVRGRPDSVNGDSDDEDDTQDIDT